MKRNLLLFTSRTFVLMLFVPLIANSQTAVKDSFYVANWNLENLFDTEDDPLKNDNEFLPNAEKFFLSNQIRQQGNPGLYLQ